MHDEIKVYVLQSNRRKNLQLKAKRGRKVIAEKSAGTARRRDADREAARWERQLNDEGNPNRGRAMAWDDFRDSYIAAREGKVADSTLSGDETTISAFSRVVGSMKPADILTEHIDQFAAGLRDEGLASASVDRHLRTLRAALRWGHRRRIVLEVPSFDLQGGQTAKGRPLTGEEFDRMLGAVAGVVGDENAPSWRFLLRGLWTSGMRISESLDLHWTDERRIRVDSTGRRTAFVFPPGRQKNRKADVVPCTPDFLALVEGQDREGFVFNPQPRRGTRRLAHWQTSRIIADIGRAARIVVKPAKDEDHDPAFASAHDLRRSFCDRWSRLVTPAVLMKLARHSAIQTTMSYYVGHDADAIGDAVFGAVGGVAGGVRDSVRETESAIHP